MIESAPLAYEHDETELEGILFTDADETAPSPGVLLIHEFTGLDSNILRHAHELAEAGFTVLAHDMYGSAIRPESREEASLHAHVYRDDRTLMRERAAAGLEALRTCPEADETALFALGFSFGGCAVLELARSGADLLGAASVYGYLRTDLPCSRKDVLASLLVLHGMRDKVVPMRDVAPFLEEMEAAEADCRMTIYTGAGHGFCNPDVPTDTEFGCAYCPDTHAKAQKAVLDFFRELLEARPTI